MKNNTFTGADYLLLLLYLNKCAPIKSAVRLTKMMFIFEKEIVPLLKQQGLTIDKLPEFIPYNYGPFSKDVYEQVELFQSISFIRVQDLYRDSEDMDEVDDWEESAFIDELSENESAYSRKSDGKYLKYSLIKRGQDYVISEIVPFFSAEQLDLLGQFKKRITDTSVKAILKYVYTKYPSMIEKSLIKKEVLGN